MPNIRSQSLTSDGLTIVASDGRSITLTRVDVIAHFQSETGTQAKRLLATAQWVKDSIEAALGPEQVPVLLTDFSFDGVQGLKSLGFRDG